MKKVAVVGGGLSGLVTAYYLKKKNPGWEIRIFEAASRAGGLLETIRDEKSLMECGPDAFISEKPWALELCRELGLESEIISTQSENRRSFILTRGELKPIPAGFYLTAPKSFRAWLRLPGMSFWGKVRMLADLFLPPRRDNDDESVAAFVMRRFGRETLEKLAQPMIAGIYTSLPEKLSLLATFPKFREIEKKHGSVIRGLAATDAAQAASGPRYSLFLSLRGGMGSLVEKLEKKLENFICHSTPIQTVEKEGQGWRVLTPWSAYDADALCLAIPSHEAARMLSEACPELSNQLTAIRFEPVATINYLFERRAVKHPLDGFGFVVPASEKSNLIGCSFSHQKFEGRVFDKQYVLLRAFAGGAYGDALFREEDEKVIATVFDELKTILKITGDPIKTQLSRYPKGMPQYEVGHLEHVHQIFSLAQKEKGLFLTGLSYHGIGIPDCVRSAGETAEKMSAFLETLGAHLRS